MTLRQVFSDDFIHPQDCLPNGAVKLRRPIPVIRESVRNPGWCCGGDGRRKGNLQVEPGSREVQCKSLDFFSKSFKKDCGEIILKA